MSVRLDEDKVIKLTKDFTMAVSCNSVTIQLHNVIAVHVDSWESSQIKADVRITDKVMNDLCKAWIKHKNKKP